MTVMQAEKILEEYKTPGHVRKHCRKVMAVANFLAQKFSRQGITLNTEELIAAALLHDFVRVVDFRTFAPETFEEKPDRATINFWEELRTKYAGLHHADAGSQLLEERGEHELARLVASHRFSHIEKGFTSWEEKILFYADKRVKHDKIVPLPERLEDGRKRNMPNEEVTEKSRRTVDAVFRLEREICDAAGITPDEIQEEIQ